MGSAIYWIIIAVLFVAFLVFFIKWLLLRGEIKKENVEEEIISMVDEGFEQGVLEDSEAEMIHNIFEFGDKQTQDIMTNRSNIAAIDAESTLAEAKEMMLKLPYSRYPVFINDLDHIIGIIHLKDIVRYTDEEHDEQEIIKNCKSLLRKAIFIPETKDVDDLFRRMQAERIQMAIVVDEYGQTSGLIAMEDILEEIVGDIYDEFDEFEKEYEQIDENTYVIDGGMPIYECNKILDIEIPEGDYETLSGYIIDELGRIPGEKEKPVLELENVVYKVEKIKSKRIIKVKVCITDAKDEVEE